jgi:hypothetical protein
VNRGVPQGSTLSPFLFDIFINNLVEKFLENGLNFMNILLYADDIAILFKDETELLKLIEILNNWTIIYNLKINKDKSGILYLNKLKKYGDQLSGYPIV